MVPYRPKRLLQMRAHRAHPHLRLPLTPITQLVTYGHLHGHFCLAMCLPPISGRHRWSHILSENRKLHGLGANCAHSLGPQFIYLSFGIFTLILTRFSDKSGEKQWKVFKNGQGSSPTTPFRLHLKVHHGTLWMQECIRLNIPAPVPEEEAPEPMLNAPKTEPFTRDGLLRHLIRFVSSDDQVRFSNECFIELLNNQYYSR